MSLTAGFSFTGGVGMLSWVGERNWNIQNALSIAEKMEMKLFSPRKERKRFRTQVKHQCIGL